MTARTRNDAEILEGSLSCAVCRQEFSISDGIAHLLCCPSDTVQREREAYRRSRDEVHQRIAALTPQLRDEELRSIAFMEHTGEHFRQTSQLNLDGVLRAADFHQGQWLLELGAGSGWLTARWATLGLRCIALDIAAELKLELSPLVMAREGVYYDRVLGDMTNLPLLSGAVDWVFVSASLHHAESLPASLAEVTRVLKPRGALVAINEPMHGLIRRSGKRFVDKAAQENPGIHEQSYSYLQWRAALRRAALRPVFLFPEYYRAMAGGRVGAPPASQRLARLGAFLLRSPLRHLILARLPQEVARLLLGFNVCMVARKAAVS